MRKNWAICFILLPAVVVGCKREQRPTSLQEISVTNTYLASAASDICGGETRPFCLAPPGMCPGHFDLSPEQLRRLLNSKILFRFDFQSGLDDKLKRLNCTIVPIRGRPGMCIPDTYLATCRDMQAVLTEQFPGRRTIYAANIDKLRQRLDRIATEIKSRVDKAHLQGMKVIASQHQADFARWLGLDVVATFKSADLMTPADIAACLRAGRAGKVQIIIANLQEGTRLPQQIAGNLKSKLVVFSNFPDVNSYPEHAFEHLLQANTDKLLKTMPAGIPTEEGKSMTGKNGPLPSQG